MKHLFRIIILLFVFYSCEESRIKVFNLINEDFTSKNTDSMVVYVDEEGGPLEFTGTLKLIEGKCRIILTTPFTDTLYKEVPYYTYDTIYKVDSIYYIDSLAVYDTTFSIESINLLDTLYITDTLVIHTDTIYQKTFRASNTFTFEEEFDRILGDWRFYYILSEIDDTDLDGSLDFTIKYEN